MLEPRSGVSRVSGFGDKSSGTCVKWCADLKPLNISVVSPQRRISPFNGQKLKLKPLLTCPQSPFGRKRLPSTRGFLCSPVDLLKKLVEILLYLQQVSGGPETLSGQGTSMSLTRSSSGSTLFGNLSAKVILAPSLPSRKAHQFPLPLNEVFSLQLIQIFSAVVCDFPFVFTLFQCPGFR